MLRKLITTLFSAFLLAVSISPVKAESIENGSEYVEKFHMVVYASDSYKKYQDEIESIFVDKIVTTDQGIRCTMVFNLYSSDESSKQLVYVGDDNGTILLNTLDTYSNNYISSLNLLNNINSISNFSSRGAAYICFTKVCQSKSYQFGVQPACAQTVGLPCSDKNIYKKSISKIACRFSVWTICNLLTNYVCNSYYELQDVCTF